MLQIFTSPDAQARAAGLDDFIPALRITELSLNKGEQYEISILAEKDALATRNASDDIAGIDSQTGELIWDSFGTLDSDRHPSDTAWKQSFYKSTLTHINRMVQQQGHGIEVNHLMHDVLRTEGGYDEPSDLFSIVQTFSAMDAA